MELLEVARSFGATTVVAKPAFGWRLVNCRFFKPEDFTILQGCVKDFSVPPQ
jgi:hypothetical protein